MLEDVFTGKSATFFVPNNDPTSKEVDPLSDVATVLDGLEPGAILDVETEKQKGRGVVKSLAKAEHKPGEELPNGFVFVETREDRDKSGKASLVVTLSKFGREVQVGVPMVRDDDVRDAEWEPDPRIDRVLRQLQNGDVVEALVKTGRQPTLVELYRYEKPERGKFVGIKDVEFNTWPAAGFEIMDAEGVTITFTVEGTEQSRNGQTIYAPNPQHFQAVKRLKPDTEVEVRYRRDGRTWLMRDIKVLSLPEKKAKAPKSGKAAPAKSDDAGEKDDEKKPDDEKKMKE